MTGRLAFDFGALPSPLRFEGTEWAVEPVPRYEQVVAEWQAVGPDPTWVYPPIQHTERRVGFDTELREFVYEPIPDSERGALLWTVPPTHRLFYRGQQSLDFEDLKNGLATFLIHLIGTLHGVEVQHADWAVIGRQHKRTGGMFVVTPQVAIDVVHRAATWYESLQSVDVRTTITSALYLHNRVPSYEFEWERFAWQYSVFDAAWFAVTGDRTESHRKRLQFLAERLGMNQDPNQFGRWVDFRNDLMHQVLWGKAIPGYRPSEDVRWAYLLLRSFTTIALLATVGYTGPGLRADWKSRARHLL